MLKGVSLDVIGKGADLWDEVMLKRLKRRGSNTLKSHVNARFPAIPSARASKARP
jgi:hypothetical protein